MYVAVNWVIVMCSFTSYACSYGTAQCKAKRRSGTNPISGDMLGTLLIPMKESQSQIMISKLQ